MTRAIVTALALAVAGCRSPPPPATTTLPANVAPSARVAAAPDNRLLGRWRVVGCETSPRDPANCAVGDIVFDAARWSIALGCCKLASAYTIVSTQPGEITVDSEGKQTVIHFTDHDHASWWPSLFGGRVGTLTFERVSAAGSARARP